MVFASSKVTTASRPLTSALITPSSLVKDLFTEIAQKPHVIPGTESVTALISANALVAKSAVAMRSKTVFFMSVSEKEPGCIRESGGATNDP